MEEVIEGKVDRESDTISTQKNQSPDAPHTGKFTWKIENLSSKLNIRERLTSDSFAVGGYKWRVLVFHEEGYLSLYLDSADAAELPFGWSRLAHFTFSLVDQIDPELTVKRDLPYCFSLKNPDYGFPMFLSLEDLHNPSQSFLVKDSIIVEVEVDVQKVPVTKKPVRKVAVRKRPVKYAACDSKKETGYVGLKNHGVTCYLNSLLQTLYHLPCFRKAVYHVPTTEDDLPSESLPLALQRLFYEMQCSDTAPETVVLMKSFGWDPSRCSRQQDVHELDQFVCEKLEEKMKGTPADGTIEALFEGHAVNIIECIDVEYTSTCKQSFNDLQLDVKGCKDIYESLDKYVEVEKLEGENQYSTEQFGLQDATKGVTFIDFPPVLKIQLKRFQFNPNQDRMVKINDCYKFPLELDLDKENGKYLSPEAGRSEPNLYTLHSVLVHSGSPDAGHYYAFIRPTLSDQWYKFDDDLVTKEESKTVLEEHCGKDQEVPRTNPAELNVIPSNSTNAYMLVYIRESHKDRVLCSIDEEDIAEHLRIAWLKKEEPRKRCKTTERR